VDKNIGGLSMNRLVFTSMFLFIYAHILIGCATTDIGTKNTIKLDKPTLEYWEYANAQGGLICMPADEHQKILLNLTKLNVYIAGLEDRLSILESTNSCEGK